MSLMSLAAPEHHAVWRVSFGLAGAVGLLAAARRLAIPAWGGLTEVAVVTLVPMWAPIDQSDLPTHP
jgi:hypothetical protein